MFDHTDEEGPNNKGVAFALWLACLMGLCGIHRLYLGRIGTGLLWLFTGGLLGIGQFVDLFLLPGMVREENMKSAAFRALQEKRMLGAMQQRQMAVPALQGQLALPLGQQSEPDTPEKFRMKLVKAAAKYGGKLTVTQGVLETGKSFEEVEKELDSMSQSGYVGIDNDEQTGAVVYTFGQLEN